MKKKSKSVYNRHDHYIANKLKDIEKARAFFKAYLPDAFKKEIDFDSIMPDELDTKVLSPFGHKMADFLFKVKFKKEDALLFIHIEHYSTPKKFIPVKILTYKGNILCSHIKKHSKDKDFKLPPIITIVYYHGRQSPYPHPKKYTDLFTDLSEEQKQLLVDPVWIDLSTLDDETLLTHGEMAVPDILMKHCFDENNNQLMRHVFSLLQEAQKTSKIDEDDLKYESENRESPPDEFLAVAKEFLDEDSIVSVADQLREEGKKEVAKNLLADGFDVARVAKNTGLDLEIVKKIKESIH